MERPDLATARPEEVLAAGGWDPRFARLLRVEIVGDECLVLVDSNGDGAAIEADFYALGDDGWVGRGSSGVGSGYTGWFGGLVWTMGRRPGKSRIRVQFDEGIREVDVDENGWWVVTEDGPWGGTCPRALD